eukprot:jgi/Mesvir1/447/Mv11325-RA.1
MAASAYVALLAVLAACLMFEAVAGGHRMFEYATQEGSFVDAVDRFKVGVKQAAENTRGEFTSQQILPFPPSGGAPTGAPAPSPSGALPDPTLPAPVASPGAPPFNAIYLIISEFTSAPGQTRSLSCTGVAITPRHVLTSGQCVYTRDLNFDGAATDPGQASSILLAPGISIAPTGEINAPFGSTSAVRVRVQEGWVQRGAFEEDLALITLGAPLGENGRYLSIIDTADNASPLSSSGYPFGPCAITTRGITGQFLWTDALVIDFSPNSLHINAISCPGMAGAPWWDPDTQRVHGLTSYTITGLPGLFATRINPVRAALIQGWINEDGGGM